MADEPHVQPLIKLTARRKAPWVRHDWTAEALRDVARWANRRLWRYCSFEEYDRHRAPDRAPSPDQLALELAG